MVPTLSIVFMGCTLVFVVLAAIILPVIIKKKGNTAIAPYFIGWAVFLVFALILESIVHMIVLGAAGDAILNNKWLYALYGGFAAGIFEETGRFCAMKLLMKKYYGNPHNALMYGAGHGCFEALALIGTGMLANIALSVMINAGKEDMLLSTVPDTQKEALQTMFTQLKETASYTILLSSLERVTAIMLHIALSVLVWTAVVKKKPLFFVLAVLLHAAPDGLLVILQKSGVNIILLEVILFAVSAAIAVFSYTVWKKHLRTAPQTAAADASAAV
ncbi:MAG: YhfC family intramembrane metalloprotease [Oscillospiraceae bacterium]|nr:YhfC family intramembrane metalloprotease [Oscillospiraceae bacterium]